MDDNRTIQIDVKTIEDLHIKPHESHTDPFAFFKKKQTVDDRISESRIFDVRKIEHGSHINRKDLIDIQKAYEVLEEFAEGGLGKIKKGKDKVLERQVAIKSLKEKFLAEESIIENFAEEAKLTAQLDHPAIIPFYGINTDDHNGIHLVMKLISGITLRHYIDQIILNYKIDGIKTYDERAGIASRLERFLKICEAISYAHNKKVIHRDLKPENIMLGDFGEVYVMDWGIAIVLQDEQQSAVKAAGTPAYIAPEILNSEPFTVQADVFSLGMILFELVTLNPGVKGDKVPDILAYVKNGIFEKPEHRYAFHISSDLKAIILKAIAPDPAKRYKTVEELASDIRAYLRFDAIKARPDNPIRKTGRWLFKHKITAAFMMLTIVLLCLSMVIASLYKQKELIKESKRNELLISGTQSLISSRAYAIDRIFLNLQNRLETFGDKLIYMLEHPVNGKPGIYSNTQFSNPATIPQGTIYSSLYGTKVNLSYPVYKTPTPAVSAEDLAIFDAIAANIGLDMKKALFESDMDTDNDSAHLEKEALEKGFPMRWISAGFTTGFFISYPGKGGYPEGFDPRKRPWYALGLKGRRCQWGSPYLDINGLGIMLPGAISLYDSKDSFRGVAAMDVTFDFIRRELMNSNEKGSVKYLLDENGNLIISTDKENDNIVTDSSGNKTLNLKKFPDQNVLKTMMSEKSGLIDISHNGKDILLFFAPVPSLGWIYLEKYEKAKLLATSSQK